MVLLAGPLPAEEVDVPKAETSLLLKALEVVGPFELHQLHGHLVCGDGDCVDAPAHPSAK